MNNLTTRKIVLGMLITLVLAFSVQGIADAQLTLGKTSGDLQLKQRDQTGQARSNFSPLVFSVNGLDTTVEATETEVDVSENTIFYHHVDRKDLYATSSGTLVDSNNRDAYVRNDTGRLVVVVSGTTPPASPATSQLVVSGAANSAIAAVSSPSSNPFRISDSKLYHLNTLIVAKKTKTVNVDLQDLLTITYMGGGAQVTQITGVSEVSSTSSLTLSNNEKINLYEVSDLDGQERTGVRIYETLTRSSISMSFSFTGLGEHTVEVSHALGSTVSTNTAGDGSNGLPDNTVLAKAPPNTANLITFTVYAVKQTSEYDTSTFTAQAAHDVTYGSELKSITVTLSDNGDLWVPVVFDVVDGRGQLFEVEHEIDTTPGRTLEATTGADTSVTVLLQPRGGTNKVLVSLPRTTEQQEITYFYGGIHLKYVSGGLQNSTPDDTQRGNFGTQLAEPFIVQVLDRSNGLSRDGRPVAGQGRYIFNYKSYK